MITSSCDKQDYSVEEILNRSEMLIEHDPDSVYKLLTTEMHPENLNEDLYAEYVLLLVQAKDKTQKSLHNDTIIFKAKDYYIKNRNKNKAALALFYSGRVFSLNNQKQKARNAYVDAEGYLKDSDDYTLKGLIKYFIGDLYFDQLLKDEAIKQYKEASIYFNRSGKYGNELMTFEKLGITFLMKKEIDSCLYYYNKAISLSQSQNDSIEQARMSRSIGLVFSQLGNYEQARLYFRKSISYFKNPGNKANTYLDIAYSFNDSKNRDSTLYYANKSLELIGDNDYELRQAIYQLIIEMEKQDSDYGKTYHKNYNKTLFRILKETDNQAILDVQKKYDFELIQNENNRLLIHRQTAFLIILGLIAVILALNLYYSRKNIKNKIALADAEQKASQLTDMADSFGEKEDSFKKLLLQHFNILKKVALIETHLKEEEKKQGRKLLKKVNEIIYNEGSVDWDLILKTIDQLCNRFPTVLYKICPQLDDSEFKICCLTYADLNNAEIAIIMRLSVNTVQMKKSNVRKKLGIEGYGNLKVFLSEYVKC